MDFLSIFNNREIATIAWVVVLFVWLFIKHPAVYKSALNLLVTIIKMWKHFLLMIAYVLVSVFILSKLHLWDSSLMKVTIIWFFGSGVVMFINSMKIGKEDGYLQKIILEMVGLAVFISFISNFYSFSLWLELLLVPFVALLAGMSAVASFNQKHKLVGKLTNNVLIGLGLIVFSVSLYKTVVDFGDFATINTLREFLVPVLLSFMFIPFAYALSVYGRWEQKKLIARFAVGVGDKK